MGDWSIFASEKEKEDDFQPTKKRRTKLSTPKGKQRSKLKVYHWRSILKGYMYVPKILTTQWAVSDCVAREISVVLF